MRLAVVSPFVDKRHGTERALAEVLERLSRDFQCEIHLYSERVEDLGLADPTTLPSAGQGSIRWHKVPSIPGPHLVKFLGWMIANTLRRWRDRVFGHLRYDLTLSPGINCGNADVILIHVVFQQLWNLSRGNTYQDRNQPGVFRALHRRLYYALLAALERYIYSNRNVALAAVSQRTAYLLEQFFDRDDVHLIPNGVDTQEFCVGARIASRNESRRLFGLHEADFVLLVIGNDWRMKGVPEILSAMAQLPSLPLQLLVVGDDAAESFRDMARRLGVFERCHWEAPRREVIDFYAAADIYVSPSREDSFGLPVAEAMACGLPVITSVCAGVAASIHDGSDGFVMRDPGDTMVLADLVERLYKDEPHRNRIGDAAARTAGEWSWDRSAEKLWKLLQDLVQAKSGPDEIKSRE